jgi:predicted RNA-binding protein with PUA-like domain
VRNWRAADSMKQMKVGDLAFFYHTGDEKQIMGIVKIVKEYCPDHTNETRCFGMVDIKTVKRLKFPVTLAEVKADERFAETALVHISRLSVQPVDEKS